MLIWADILRSIKIWSNVKRNLYTYRNSYRCDPQSFNPVDAICKNHLRGIANLQKHNILSNYRQYLPSVDPITCPQEIILDLTSIIKNNGIPTNTIHYFWSKGQMWLSNEYFKSSAKKMLLRKSVTFGVNLAIKNIGNTGKIILV